MKWLESMNRAMDYIEQNLCGKLNYEKIAQTACCSVYHFQRMFTFMTDITLSEYIRRRKMSEAALQLQSSDIKIIDLALQFGYESPEAFSRAFQSIHGISPSAARRSKQNTKLFPRLSFQLTVKGVSEMNFRMEEKKVFSVYRIEEVFDCTDGENLKAIPLFWEQKLQSGEYDRLLRSAGFPTRINAVCGARPVEGDRVSYMLCVLNTPLGNPQGYCTTEVPAST